MDQYTITGMMCAACQAHVEKAVSKVPGVTSCTVSLLTNSMSVEGTAAPSEIIKTVEKAGYGASLRGAGGAGGGAAGAETENEYGGYLGSESGAGHSTGNAAGGAAGMSGMDEAARALLVDRETPALKKRLFTSLGFLIVLMYVSMGHNMAGFPVPNFMDNPIALALVQMILAAVVLVINRKFFINGYKTLFRLAPTMDTLVALGSTAAFGYSFVVMFMMIYQQTAGMDAISQLLQDYVGAAGAAGVGDTIGSAASGISSGAAGISGSAADVLAQAAEMAQDVATNLHHHLHNLYFEASAMIPCLITVGKLLEAISKGRTTDALKDLMKLAPQKATLIRDGESVTVDISKVRVGDVFAVKPGENVPVDGEIVKGESAVNESALTGESIPVDKKVGDGVCAATTNISGYFEARATRVGKDTTLSQIIKLVSDAAATKAPIARIADKVAYVFVPVVMGIALVTFLIWLITGQTFTFSIARAIAVLVIACPCALGLATPVAIMVGNGVGAKNGILFKTAVSEEMTGKVDIVALDKTGTITNGTPEVTDVIFMRDSETVRMSREEVEEALREAAAASNAAESSEAAAESAAVLKEEFLAGAAGELLTVAYSIERFSEHPLAGAVVRFGKTNSFKKKMVSSFRNVPGNGLEGEVDEKQVLAGSMSFIGSRVSMPEAYSEAAKTIAGEGKTVLAFAEEGKMLGIIAVADTVKEESREAIKQLKNLGIKVVMLTGDNEQTAAGIAKSVGIDRVVAGVLPDGKEAVIRELMKEGRVCMVGDGINDAPALTRADVGAAIGAGTDVAIDAADVVLMKSSLADIVAAIRLSRKIVVNIKENLFWAFFYNIICIPLAAGFYQALFGWSWEMNPMIGAACMCLSSFCVCMNALRLNMVKVRGK